MSRLNEEQRRKFTSFFAELDQIDRDPRVRASAKKFAEISGTVRPKDLDLVFR